MKHRPKDVRVKGTPMRQCRRCRLLWSPDLEEITLTTKCPGRPKR